MAKGESPTPRLRTLFQRPLMQRGARQTRGRGLGHDTLSSIARRLRFHGRPYRLGRIEPGENRRGENADDLRQTGARNQPQHIAFERGITPGRRAEARCSSRVFRFHSLRHKRPAGEPGKEMDGSIEG